MIDAIDRQIVHAMQVDGRAPFSRVATVLGVSEQTVARRWRRLRADGVVRVLGLIAPDATEPNWFVRVRVQPAAAAGWTRTRTNQLGSVASGAVRPRTRTTPSARNRRHRRATVCSETPSTVATRLNGARPSTCMACTI